jgi:pSer/pThr/pTyr-binding forkhead associated (FHA) protein
MHDDAGLRRRRRMLLMFQQVGDAPELPLPLADLAVASPNVAAKPVPDPPLSVDAELFAANAGDPNTVLLVEDLARRVLREQPLDRPVLSIGRGPENDLWLDHDRILPRHLLLLWLNGGVFFIAPSAEGQVLDGNRPVRAGWWTPGLCLRLGAFRLRMPSLRNPPPAYDPLSVSKMLQTEMPQLELGIISRKGTRRKWPVRRPLTLVGRSSICKIRLDHASILPVQAALIRTEERLWLVNFGTAEQVRINNFRTRTAELDAGDLLQFGKLRIEVQTAEVASSSGSPELVAAPATAQRNPDAEDQTLTLLRQFLDQHRKLLATHQQALSMLESLAKQTSEPEQAEMVLERLRNSVRMLDEDSSRLAVQVESAP